MRCLCGYVEPEAWKEQLEILFKSGPRKGEVKEVKTITHTPKDDELFILLRVERDFGFVRIDKAPLWSYESKVENHARLLACPKCGTVKMETYQ